MSNLAERERAAQSTPHGGSLRRGVIIAASIAAGLGLLAALWLFARPLALVGIGVVIGEALSPVVDWGSRGLPRTLSSRSWARSSRGRSSSASPFPSRSRSP